MKYCVYAELFVIVAVMGTTSPGFTVQGDGGMEKATWTGVVVCAAT
jgi:hypothetical protein